MNKNKSTRNLLLSKQKYTFILVLLAFSSLGFWYGLGFIFNWQILVSNAKAAVYLAHKEDTKNLTLLTKNFVLGEQPSQKSSLLNCKNTFTTEQINGYKKPPTNVNIVQNIKTVNSKLLPLFTSEFPNKNRQNRLPMWKRNAVLIKTDGRPQIAIILDDLGLDISRTREAMDLPGPVSLSFLAYAKDLPQQAKTGRNKGHEIWLHVPMEPGSINIDPGPNVLLSGLPPKKLLSILRWNLNQLEKYVGINNHMGSRFTADEDSMRIIMSELKNRGLAFLDSITSPKSAGTKIAQETGVPVAQRNIFIDHDSDIAAINRQLSFVEALAKRQGRAIAIGHPRTKTLKALKLWIKSLSVKGFQLVPVSSLLRFSKK